MIFDANGNISYGCAACEFESTSKSKLVRYCLLFEESRFPLYPDCNGWPIFKEGWNDERSTEELTGLNGSNSWFSEFFIHCIPYRWGKAPTTWNRNIFALTESKKTCLTFSLFYVLKYLMQYTSLCRRRIWRRNNLDTSRWNFQAGFFGRREIPSFFNRRMEDLEKSALTLFCISSPQKFSIIPVEYLIVK